MRKGGMGWGGPGTARLGRRGSVMDIEREEVGWY